MGWFSKHTSQAIVDPQMIVIRGPTINLITWGGIMWSKMVKKIVKILKHVLKKMSQKLSRQNRGILTKFDQILTWFDQIELDLHLNLSKRIYTECMSSICMFLTCFCLFFFVYTQIMLCYVLGSWKKTLQILSSHSKNKKKMFQILMSLVRCLWKFCPKY